MKRIGFISMLLAAVMAIFHGCQETPLEEVKISLNKSLLVLEKGQTEKLSPTITPSSAAVDLTWSSADNSVAKVSSDGDVTGIAAGETVITVSAGEAKATCKVTVKPTLVEEVVLDRESAEMTIGDKLTLKATVLPADADDVAVSWKSLKEEVASVDSKGNVEALMEGSATIVASAGGKNAQCVITVKKPVVHVESVKITKSVSKIVEGESFVFEAVVTPADATDKSLTWESSDKTVLSIAADGKASALKPGKVEVVVRTTDGSKTDKCSVEVESAYVPVTKVEILEVSGVLNLKKGDTHTFAAKVYPDDATDKTVIWSVSDEKVITVDQNGKITAVGGGNAKVTVTSKNEGKTAECEVSVVVPVKDVLLSKTSAELTEGEELELTVTVNPSDATNKNVTWSSSDETVAKVMNGKVTALKPGSAKITVTTEDGGKKAECAVTVVAKTYPVTGVTLDKTSVELTEGDELQLVATVTPSNATNKNVIWSSSNEAVAKVVNGKVTAMKAGVARITVTTEDGGKKAECAVTVVAKTYPVTGVTLDKTSAELTEGGELVLTATITPSNATNKNVTWSSSDETVAKVVGGKVTALKTGVAKITVTTSDGGKTAECTVTVIAKTYPVTGVALDMTSAELTEGDELVLTSTITPSNATNKNVTWSSSDETVAKVVGGKVTALKAGSARITVTTEDGGKTASCDVTVKPRVVNVTSVEISSSPANLSMLVGDEFTFAAKVLPENATDKSVAWKSSATNVISIDGTGKAKALAPGQAVITVTSTDGGKSSSVTVKVSSPVVDVTSIEITSKPSSNKMTVGDSFTFTATVKPDNATDKTVKWSSSNTSVLSIDPSTGKATAKAAGNSTITVKSADEKVKAEVFVTVVSPESTGKVTGLTMSTDGGRDFVRHGKTLQLIPNYSPAGAYPSSSKWYSSNPKLATIDENGLVKAISFDYSQKHLYYSQNGYPEVTFTHVADNIQAIIKIKILPAVPEKILVSNPPPASMTIGQSWDFGQISILPQEAEQSVQIICTYDGEYGGALGKTFQANKVGNMAVLITANGEHAQTVHTGTDINYNIRVEPKYETAVNLSRTSHTLQAGSLFSLTAEVTPSDATFSDLSWSSSNTSVATVSNGVVRAVSPGTAEISVRTHHGKTAKCSVTVTAKASAVSIGDYYYSDGTTSSSLESGKTPVGVVFAIVDAAGSDPKSLGADHSGCTHGLVVGLESYSTKFANSIYMDIPMEDVADNAKKSGMIDMTDTNAYCGYSNTKAMKTWGEWTIINTCMSNADKYPLPGGTSGWYVPSLAEIDLLGDAYAIVNAKLEAIGTSYKILKAYEFWCSTFFGVSASSYTYNISGGDLAANLHQGATSGAAQISSTSKYARFIFAF